MLDTDTFSYIVKNRPAEIRAKLSEFAPSDLCISAITRAEIQYGLQRLPANHKLHVVVRQFFRMVKTIPWDFEAADYYAGIRHQLVTTGQAIGDMDMMIAAHSLAIGAVLVTNNTRHFERIDAPLSLVNWRLPSLAHAHQQAVEGD